MKKVSLLSLFLLSGCMNSINDGRVYNGPDSNYHSSHNAKNTAQCIEKEWRLIFSRNPSLISVTDKDVEGRYTVYSADYIYMADVKDSQNGADIVYYNNGDRLWGTKERLTGAIKRCL